jgi:outer membrane protein assembly factor BamD
MKNLFHRLTNFLRVAGPLAIVILVGIGCSSTESVQVPKSAEDVFKEGMSAFNDGNWMEAQSKFDIIKLQFPASPFADDAQFHLAEINYKRGEYILAAFNYALVRRTFPSSEYAKESLLKSADCYFELAPPPDRDQEYTRKAIQAYGEFQTVYPQDSLALIALKRIVELRGRLARKQLDAAEHYVRTLSYRASVVYYDAVIEEFADTDVYEDAVIGKLDVLLLQKKYDDARATVAAYRRTVRDSRRASEIEQRASQIP